MLTTDKNRWALSLLENTKILLEKTYPNDNKLINHIRDAIVLVCYKIEQKETDEKLNNNSRHKKPSGSRSK